MLSRFTHVKDMHRPTLLILTALLEASLGVVLLAIPAVPLWLILGIDALPRKPASSPASPAPCSSRWASPVGPDGAARLIPPSANCSLPC